MEMGGWEDTGMEAGTDTLGSYRQSGEVQPLVTRHMETSIIPNFSITRCPHSQQWGVGDKDDSGSWQGTVCFVWLQPGKFWCSLTGASPSTI